MVVFLYIRKDGAWRWLTTHPRDDLEWLKAHADLWNEQYPVAIKSDEGEVLYWKDEVKGSTPLSQRHPHE